jgi:hypothetical protein
MSRRPPRTPGPRWLPALLTLVGLATAGFTDCDGDGKGLCREVFGDSFDCPGGRRYLSPGEQCIDNYTITDGGISPRVGLTCPPGNFCHPTRGCQPFVAAGASCSDLPEGILWGVCGPSNCYGTPCDVETLFCYPADPEGSGTTPGPRICRPLPTTEGAFCDASVKPDCDDYREPRSESDVYFHPEYAAINTSGYRHPEWSGQSYPSEHLDPSYPYKETGYPAVRVTRLLCRDNRCVEPPGPGEACADIGNAAVFAGVGPLRFACAQPPEFTTTNAEGTPVYDFAKAVYCIEGVCTPVSTLEPDTCFAPDGATEPLDPLWCSTAAESCPTNGHPTCVSPCRDDGSCGMCPICVHEDGRRERVEGSGDCTEPGGSWTLDSGLRIAFEPTGPICGYSHVIDFDSLSPVTGELWLRFYGRGDFAVPGAAFDLLVDGTFIERWRPGPTSECRTELGYVAPEYFERSLDAAFAADGRVRVEFRGTPELCTTCRDPETCLEAPCRGNEITVELQNRTRSFLGFVRDDELCP